MRALAGQSLPTPTMTDRFWTAAPPFSVLCACASMENTRIPTAWQSSRSGCTTTSCSPAVSITLGCCLIAERASHAERYTSLVAFERCVRQAVATDKSKLLHPAPLLAFV